MLREHIHVTGDVPLMFIVHAFDDGLRQTETPVKHWAKAAVDRMKDMGFLPHTDTVISTTSDH